MSSPALDGQSVMHRRHPTGDQQNRRLRPTTPRRNVMRPLHFVAVLMLLVMLASGAALAQSATGEVNGTVLDPTGAVVSGAKVTLTSQGTKISDVRVSNSTGNFIFINLQPGDYVLSAEHPG